MRIERNTRQIVGTEADLERSRTRLAERLRSLYVNPPPTFAEVLVETGSVTAATGELDMLDEISEMDAGVVSTLKDSKARLEALRAQLLVDQRQAAAQVEHAAAQKQKVESLLAQRQAVLDNVKGELREMIRAEQERKRRIAAAQKAALAAARAGGYSGTALPSGGSNAGAVAVALQQLGTPYVWGGAAPGGFDCSGLASYAFAQIGKSVPHYTGAIWSAFPHVASGTEEPGDMVFFNGGAHMGIYIGNGQFVHAPHTGDVVRIANLADRGDYMGAVRAIGLRPAALRRRRRRLALSWPPLALLAEQDALHVLDLRVNVALRRLRSGGPARADRPPSAAGAHDRVPGSRGRSRAAPEPSARSPRPSERRAGEPLLEGWTSKAVTV